mgnify:CR=1 FL=1
MGGHQYTAYHAPTGEEDNRLNVLYLVDDDKLKRIAKEYFSSRPVVAIILIDNYEELLQRRARKTSAPRSWARSSTNRVLC